MCNKCYNSCRPTENMYCEDCVQKLKDRISILEESLDSMMCVAYPLYEKLQRPQEFKKERKKFVLHMRQYDDYYNGGND